MTLFAAAVLLQQHALPPADQLLAQAIRNYATTSSLVAVVDTEVTSGETTVKIRTDLQYSKPAQFYLRQVKTAEGPIDRPSRDRSRTALVISDGRQLSYDHPAPEKRALGQRAFELARSVDDRPHDLANLYTMARGSMIDQNVVFDFLIFDKQIHEGIPGRFSRLQTLTRTEVNGKPAYIVQGVYKELDFEYPFRMTVDAQGNLSSFAYSLTLGNDHWQQTVDILHRVRAEVNPKRLDGTRFDIRRTQ